MNSKQYADYSSKILYNIIDSNSISDLNSLCSIIYTNLYKIFKNSKYAKHYIETYALPLVLLSSESYINSYILFNKGGVDTHNLFKILHNVSQSFVDAFVINGILSHDSKHKIVYYGDSHITHLNKYLINNGYTLKYEYVTKWSSKFKRCVDVSKIFNDFLY
jgi:hypothetical protein